MEGIPTFQWATVIDLSMGYYAFALHPNSKAYTTTIFPWGLYQHNYLLMGLKIGSDVLQASLGLLFNSFEDVHVYMDDIILFGTTTFLEHLARLQMVLSRLRENNYK